jgi:hypothetical protein
MNSRACAYRPRSARTPAGRSVALARLLHESREAPAVASAKDRTTSAGLSPSAANADNLQHAVCATELLADKLSSRSAFGCRPKRVLTAAAAEPFRGAGWSR